MAAGCCSGGGFGRRQAAPPNAGENERWKRVRFGEKVDSWADRTGAGSSF